jgi:hypothetical protein
MQGTLLLTILTVKSSYARAVELPLASAADVPDTLQWWVTAASDGAWRIRTYAIDHDIHTHHVVGDPEHLLALARENNRKHFAGLIRAEHALNFADCDNENEVKEVFRRVGIVPQLEIAAGRFAFWNPDEARYWTQSEPRDS